MLDGKNPNSSVCEPTYTNRIDLRSVPTLAKSNSNDWEWAFRHPQYCSGSFLFTALHTFRGQRRGNYNVIISDITIQNVRGIKTCEIRKLEQINLFIGKNSMGKSTILESIQLIPSLMFYPLAQVSVIVNRRSDRSWHPRELWHKYNRELELSVSLSFDTGKSLRLVANTDKTDPESLVFNITDSENMTEVKRMGSEQMRGLEEQNMRRGQTTFRPDRRNMGKIRLPEEILRFLEGVTFIDPIGKRQTNVLEEEFQEVKFSGKYAETVKALKQSYDERMQSWELFPYLTRRTENRTAFMYEGQPVYVDDLGDGVKYGFAAITLAYNRHDTALLLEEIETHQHPSSLRKLVERLIEIAKNNNLQLFVSTQSPDVLRYFKHYYPVTKIFLIEKDPAKDIVHAGDEEDLLKVFREVGWDIEDLLRYEKIAIVDGIEDEIIIRDFFQKMRGYPLDSEGVKLLLVRGDQKKFGEIVRTVATSSREVIVIKDLDEMIERNDVVKLVTSWLTTLGSEGWAINEETDQITGEHSTSGKKWKVLKSRILKAGDRERFPDYKKHSITDYLLRTILDNQELASRLGLTQKVSEYELTGESSKQELELLLKKYNMEIVTEITKAIDKEMIPKSINDDIIMSI